MAGTWSAQSVIDNFIAQWGFDVTEAEALTWLKSVYSAMLRRSRSGLSEGTLGTTVAGQASYVLSGNIVEIKEISVDGVPYRWAPHSAVVEYARGELLWEPASDGLFTITTNSLAQDLLTLIPTPTQSGLTIKVYQANGVPSTFVLGTVLTGVSDEWIPALQDGMAAMAYSRDAEQAALADRCQARFDAACEELRRETRRRMRSGVARIRLG